MFTVLYLANGRASVDEANGHPENNLPILEQFCPFDIYGFLGREEMTREVVTTGSILPE
jgi:hypothetical protein